MFFFFILGEQKYRRTLAGYENAPPVRCANCGNYDGFATKTWHFITFCWIPVIPLSIHGYKDIHCNRCNFDQLIEHRPDVQQMMNGGSGQQQWYPLPQGHQMGPQQPRYG